MIKKKFPEKVFYKDFAHLRTRRAWWALFLITASAMVATKGCKNLFESKQLSDSNKNLEKPVKRCDFRIATYNLQDAYDCNIKNNDPYTPSIYSLNSNWQEGEDSSSVTSTPPCVYKQILTKKVIEDVIFMPEILALQEIESALNNSQFLEQLNSRLTKPYKTFLTGPQQVNNPVLHTMGFLSKFSVKESYTIPYTSQNFKGAARDPFVIRFNELPNLTLINSHWKSPAFDGSPNVTSERSSEKPPYFYAQREVELLIKAEVNKIWSQNPDEAIVILGDLNAAPDAELVKDLLGQPMSGFRSVWEFADSKKDKLAVPGTVTSFDGIQTKFIASDNIILSHHFFEKSGRYKFVVGPNIFGPNIPFMSYNNNNAPKGWKVSTDKLTGKSVHSLERSGPSDHFPLSVTLAGPCLSPSESGEH